MIIFFCAITVIPIMLIIGGLSVDLAAYGTLKDRLQVAADASATAAASAYHWEKKYPDCRAQCEGRWVTNADLIPAYVALNGGFHVEQQVLLPSVPKARVVVRATMPTSFLRLIGIKSLSSGAVAEAVRVNIEQSDRDAEPTTPGKSRLTR